LPKMVISEEGREEISLSTEKREISTTLSKKRGDGGEKKTALRYPAERKIRGKKFRTDHQ